MTSHSLKSIIFKEINQAPFEPRNTPTRGDDVERASSNQDRSLHITPEMEQQLLTMLKELDMRKKLEVGVQNISHSMILIVTVLRMRKVERRIKKSINPQGSRCRVTRR
ncbi:hypothetical protein Tco_1091036 [Tanacetum coccineum]|uniref:Uncharacterized protein n=1 Tax=Tanacetum coccineum TaxID=301880 RepID=A0ABQ5I616_9ASTR